MSDTYTPFAPLRYNQQEVSRQGWGMASAGPTNEQKNVGFYPRPIPIGRSANGKPVYKTIDHVKISHPGEANLQVTDRPVTEQDTIDYPRQWAQYRAGREQIPDGIPLDLLFPNHPHIALTLRGHGIHTVEQLAKLSGQGVSNVGMGCQEWVNAAAKYMVMAEKGVDYHKFDTAIKSKDQEIKTLRRQIEELTHLVHQNLARPSEPPPYHQPVQQTIPQDHDYQTEQLNAAHASADDSQAFLQPPVQFVQDVSGSVEPPKRKGWPKGKPRKLQGDMK